MRCYPVFHEDLASSVCCIIVQMMLALGMLLPVQAEEWQILTPGLELRQFLVPDQRGDLAGEQGVLAVLRIDPQKYEFVLGAAKASGSMLTMQEWARRENFLAVINAGMFRSDNRMLSTGFMRDARVMVNSYVHPAYGALLAFQPRDPSLPPIRWVDLKSEPNWQAYLTAYDGIIQNYRLFSSNRVNLWTPDERRHSAAGIGVDADGNVLFIHCRPLVTMAEFSQALLDLPLNLRGAMYVEGGADAAMYIGAGSFVGRYVGEFQTDFFQGSNKNFWPAPNVLGIRPK